MYLSVELWKRTVRFDFQGWTMGRQITYMEWTMMRCRGETGQFRAYSRMPGKSKEIAGGCEIVMVCSVAIFHCPDIH